VIYLCEPIDEMTLQNVEKYNDKVITDAGKELNLDVTEEEKRERELKNEAIEDFRIWFKKILGDKITRVEASTRLVDSPATLVQSEYGVSPSMQKYLRAQAVVEDDDKGQFANIFNQAVLEVNPDHPIIIRLKALQEADGGGDEAKETAELVFNTAALAAGYVLDNAADYSQMVTKMMTRLADNNVPK
jgi:HSP90 family molecular chaperone